MGNALKQACRFKHLIKTQSQRVRVAVRSYDKDFFKNNVEQAALIHSLVFKCIDGLRIKRTFLVCGPALYYTLRIHTFCPYRPFCFVFTSLKYTQRVRLFPIMFLQLVRCRFFTFSDLKTFFSLPCVYQYIRKVSPLLHVKNCLLLYL